MFWASILFILIPFNSYAYLDPGTGSIILQAVLGAFTVALVTGKIYWLKI